MTSPGLKYINITSISIQPSSKYQEMMDGHRLIHVGTMREGEEDILGASVVDRNSGEQRMWWSVEHNTPPQYSIYSIQYSTDHCVM